MSEPDVPVFLMFELDVIGGIPLFLLREPTKLESFCLIFFYDLGVFFFQRRNLNKRLVEFNIFQDR